MSMIETKYGQLKESELEKRTPSKGVTEYYYKGELIHRSVEIVLTGIQASGIAKI